MERRALIALALSFVVFMAFMYYGEKTKTPHGARCCQPKSRGATGGPGPGAACGRGAPPRRRRRR